MLVVGCGAMDLNWIKDLDKLARTGNFSQAAKLSNLSQPAFSRRIAALEAWVGAQLVDRSKQPVVLTLAGSQFLEAGQQAVFRIESERGLILESLALPDKYVVTFAAQHSISWRFFPEWMQHFEAVFGPVMTRLRADDLTACLEDLNNSNVDFVMAYTRAGSQVLPPMPALRLKTPLESLLVGSDRLIPVCKRNPDGSPLFKLEPGGAKVPFLKFSQSSPIHQLIAPVLNQFDINSMVSTVYENSMAGALRLRARDGGGIAWLPESLIRPDLEGGLLTSTGDRSWDIALDVRLFRLHNHTNHVTRGIWAFLSRREQFPLVPVTQGAIGIKSIEN